METFTRDVMQAQPEQGQMNFVKIEQPELLETSLHQRLTVSVLLWVHNCT